MCADVMRSGRVYRPAAPITRLAALIARPNPPEPTPPVSQPPAGQSPDPASTEPATRATTSPPKKDQPSADITAQLKKVKADISIWDLIHSSREHREAFLRVFQAAHVSQTIEPSTLENMVGMIAEPQVISFSSDELPPAGTNHNQPLFITV